jgi:mono/diheme cytochrome c family protein
MNIKCKNIILAATIGLVTLCFVVVAIAAEGNVRKGRMLFSQNCRACHSGAGEAGDLNPVMRTKAEWYEAFQEENYTTYPCADKWEKLSEQDIIDIRSYFKDGASDGRLPVGCG